MKELTIKEFCYISDGNYSSKYPRSEEFVSEGIPFIRANNIANGTVIADEMYYISSEKHAELRKGHLKENDVLITTRGNIGQTAIVPAEFNDANINAQIVLLRVNNDLVNPHYLLYALHSEFVERQIRSSTTGTALKQLPVGRLEKIKVRIHSINDQKAIIAVMQRMDNIIALRKQQLEKLDELVKARFVELFGDPKTNNKEWKMNTFADICSVRQGLQIPISKRLTQCEEGCYEYITVAYLHGSKEREYIKNPKSTVICTKDDILMTRTGNTGMVITDVAGVFHNNFFLVDFDRTRYNKVFLAQYLNLDLIQAEIKRRAGTSTIPDLNHGEFYAIAIYEPPIELQNQFAALVEQTDESKLAIQKSLEQLETLKKALMQQYFG